MLAALLYVLSNYIHYSRTPVEDIEILVEVGSPDGEYIAAVFDSMGGATVGFSTKLHLRESGASLNPTDGGLVLNVYERHELSLEWTGNRELKVLHANDFTPRNVYLQLRRWRDVEVLYVRE